MPWPTRQEKFRHNVFTLWRKLHTLQNRAVQRLAGRPQRATGLDGADLAAGGRQLSACSTFSPRNTAARSRCTLVPRRGPRRFRQNDLANQVMGNPPDHTGSPVHITYG